VIDGVQRPNQCLADFIAPKDSGVQITSVCLPSLPVWESKNTKNV
jgi:cobalamin-dependent methionine synthase I